MPFYLVPVTDRVPIDCIYWYPSGHWYNFTANNIVTNWLSSHIHQHGVYSLKKSSFVLHNVPIKFAKHPPITHNKDIILCIDDGITLLNTMHIRRLPREGSVIRNVYATSCYTTKWYIKNLPYFNIIHCVVDDFPARTPVWPSYLTPKARAHPFIIISTCNMKVVWLWNL